MGPTHFRSSDLLLVDFLLISICFISSGATSLCDSVCHRWSASPLAVTPRPNIDPNHQENGSVCCCKLTNVCRFDQANNGRKVVTGNLSGAIERHDRGAWIYVPSSLGEKERGLAPPTAPLCHNFGLNKNAIFLYLSYANYPLHAFSLSQVHVVTRASHRLKGKPDIVHHKKLWGCTTNLWKFG